MSEQLRFEIVVDDKGSSILKAFARNVIGTSAEAEAGIKKSSIAINTALTAIGVSSLKNAEGIKSATKSVSEIHQSFRILTPYLAKLDKDWKDVGSTVAVNAAKVGTSIAGAAGAAVTGIGALIIKAKAVGVIAAIVVGTITLLTLGMKSLVKEAAEAEEINNRLTFRFKALGYQIKGDNPEIDKWSKGIQNVTRYSDEAVRGGLSQMLMYTDDIAEAQKGVQLAMDMSVESGTSLERNIRLIGFALDGNIEALGRILPEFRNWKSILGESATTAEKTAWAMNLLNKTFGGAAQADAKTANGAWDQLKNSIGELGETIGEKFLPTWSKLLGGLKSAADYINSKLSPAFKAEKVTMAELADEQQRLLKLREEEVKRSERVATIKDVITDQISKVKDMAAEVGKLTLAWVTGQIGIEEYVSKLQKISPPISAVRDIIIDQVSKIRDMVLAVEKLTFSWATGKITIKEYAIELGKLAETTLTKVKDIAVELGKIGVNIWGKVTEKVTGKAPTESQAIKKIDEQLKVIDTMQSQKTLEQENIQKRKEELAVLNALEKANRDNEAVSKRLNELERSKATAADQSIKAKLQELKLAEQQELVEAKRYSENKKYVELTKSITDLYQLKKLNLLYEEASRQIQISETLLQEKATYASLTGDLQAQQRILDAQLANKISQLNLDVKRRTLTQEQAAAQITMLTAIRAEEVRRLPFTTLGITPMADQVRQVENQKAAVEKLNLAWLTGQVSIRDYAAALDALTKTMSGVTGGNVDKMYEDALATNKKNLAEIDKMNIKADQTNKKRAEEASRFAEEMQKISEIERPDVRKKEEELRDLSRQYEKIKADTAMPITMNLDLVTAQSSIDSLNETAGKVKIMFEDKYKIDLDTTAADNAINSLIMKIRTLKSELSSMPAPSAPAPSATAPSGGGGGGEGGGEGGGGEGGGSAGGGGEALGGLITRPTLAMLAEAGPELVIPIDKVLEGISPTAIGKIIKQYGGLAGADTLDSMANIEGLKNQLVDVQRKYEMYTSLTGGAGGSGLSYAYGQPVSVLTAKIEDLQTEMKQTEDTLSANVLRLAATYTDVLKSYEEGTNFVPSTGVYKLHKGERVVPANQNTNFGNVTIAVPPGTTRKQAVALWSEFEKLAKYKQRGALKS